METDKLIADRASTHGNWILQARTAYTLKAAAHNGATWAELSPEQCEAIDMVLTKVSRIVNGDPNEPDHWQDIQGYARLGEPYVKDNAYRGSVRGGGGTSEGTLRGAEWQGTERDTSSSWSASR